MNVSEDINLLLQKWRSQRASRVNLSVARYGIVLALLSIGTDFLFNRTALTIAGAVLAFIGCLIITACARRKWHPQWLWIPLYFGFWSATSTCLFDTGGINSPFIGSFLSLLFVGGLVIQNQIRPLVSTLFVFLNFGTHNV